MIFTYVGGWVSDKYSERLSISMGFFVAFLGYVILVQSTDFVGFAISRMAFGVGWGLMWSAYDSLISKAVPEEIRGLVFGMFEDLVEGGKTIIMVTHDRELAGNIPRVEEVRNGMLMSPEEIDRRLVGR